MMPTALFPVQFHGNESCARLWSDGAVGEALHAAKLPRSRATIRTRAIRVRDMEVTPVVGLPERVGARPGVALTRHVTNYYAM